MILGQLVNQHVAVVDVCHKLVLADLHWLIIVVAPVGTASDVVGRADGGEVVVAAVGRLARVHQDTHQVVQPVTNSKIWS